MRRRTFLSVSGVVSGAVAAGLPFGIAAKPIASRREPLNAIPELSSSKGRLKTSLVMETAQFRVGNREITVPAYNNSLPGPTIRVKPGDTLEWDLFNYMVPTGVPEGATPEEIAKLNRLEFTNIHTHGLQVSPKEGSDFVYGKLVPGDKPQIYRYRIPGPDTGMPQPAGLCWYHPHLHGSTTHQAWQGLSGAIVIEGDIDRVPEVARAKERVMILNALYLNSDGEVPRAPTAPNAGYSPFTPIPAEPTEIVLTINGQLEPQIDISPGEVQRWRVLNAAPHRFFWLDLEGHILHQIGQDGIPFAHSKPLQRILMAPGNRAEFMVKGGEVGTYRLRALQYEQGHPGGARPERLLGTLVSSGRRRNDAIPGRLVNPPRMPDKPVARRRTISFKGEVSGNQDMPMMHHEVQGSGGAMAMPPVKFTLDGKVFDLDRIDQHVVAGTVEEWTLVNLDVFQHPFHIHVNPFQIVAMNGQPVDDPTWWDVFPLPSKGSVTIRMHFRPDITGKTVYHCHILPHEDNGMMANIMIHPAGTRLDDKGNPVDA